MSFGESNSQETKTEEAGRLASMLGVFKKHGLRALIATSDQAILSGTSFALTGFLASRLTKLDFGAYSYLTSLVMLLAGFHSVLLLEPVGILGVSRLGSRFFSYVGSLLKLHFAFCGVIVIAALAASPWLIARQADGVTFTLVLAFVFYASMTMLLALQRRARYSAPTQRNSLGPTIAFAAFVFLALIVLVFSRSLSATTALFASGCAAFVASLLGLPAVLGRGTRRTSEPSEPSEPITLIARENWRYGRLLLISTLLYWACGGIYVLLAAHALSLGESASLRVLQLAIMPAYQLTASLNLLLIPWLARQAQSGGLPSTVIGAKKITAIYVSIALCYLIVLTFVGSAVVHRFLGDNYREVGELLPLIALLPVIDGLSSPWMLALRVRGRTGKVLFVDALGATVTLTIGVLLTRAWGLQGAVLGMVLSMACRIPVLAWIWLRKIRRATPSETGTPA